MKSYVLHGENQVQSRKKFIELQDTARIEGLDIILFDFKKGDPKDLKLLSRSQSLLSPGVCLFIENFFSPKPQLNLIEELDPQTQLVFYEEKTLTPATTRTLQKRFTVLEFPVSTVLFKFLDSFYPNNLKTCITLFNQACKNDPTEMIFILLARHVRMLYWAKVEPKTLKAADWQQRKLIGQAEKFSADQLLNLHGKLLDLDRKSKRSLLPENLTASLELLLLNV